MITAQPVTLEGRGIRLEPLAASHHDALEAAAADGKLWELWFTSVPEPGGMQAYIDDGAEGTADGHMLPWAVRDLASDTIVGTTRYHDIVAAIDRVEIGYTLVRGQPSADQRQHDVQAAAPAARVRHAAAARSSACAPTTSTSARSARSKGIGAKKRRRPPPPRRAQGRHRPRLGDVQHPRGRVAGRQETPGTASSATR